MPRPILKLISNNEYFVQKPESYEAFDVFAKAHGFADRLVPIGRGSDQWLARWVAPAVKSARADLVTKVWNATGENEIVFFGASELIRVAERSVAPRQLNVFASRGLAGIDGSVSTVLGLAQGGKKVRAVIGDLTLLHDASGLNRTGLGSLDVQLIVGNDSGGAIFSHLEMAKLLPAEDFEKLFTTPQQVDLESLADTYGWHYIRTNPDEIDQHLSRNGFVLIDCQL